MTPTTNSETKYASEFPLPGGVEQYFDTLVGMLLYIRDNNVSPEDLSQWMFDSFPSASGQIAVNSYISVLSRMGLWLHQDDLIRLTADGTAIITKAESDPEEAHRLVMEIKYRDFLGYDVLLKLLCDGPQSLDGIHEQLKTALNVDWKSSNQTTFRVNWLRSLEYVEKDGREYRLTNAGRVVSQRLQGGTITVATTGADPSQVTGAKALSPLSIQAIEIADRLDKLALAGGDGKEFEQATEAAFRFLGFETQLISGPGNPDVLITAVMGEKTYRVLLDSKSRASGIVQQNDVNFLVLDKQKRTASADYVAVVGAGFAGGQLEEFAVKNQTRLLSTSELREILFAHADSAFPLDDLRRLFQNGGATDEGMLSELLTSADSKAEVAALAGRVFAAVREFQDKAGALHTNSLYYILNCEQPLATIKLTVDFLKADLIGAIGETERGSLYTRVSSTTLTNKLWQITRMMGLRESSK